MNSLSDVRGTDCAIECSDGYVLGGTLFEPVVPTVGYPLIIFPGVGIPARYYGSLAQWFARLGRPVLTFDYRGVGKSRLDGRVGGGIRMRDWGSKDCAGAIRALRDRYTRTPICALAHSFGAFLLGCNLEAKWLSAAALLGPHTSFPGDYAQPYRWPMTFTWHWAMPTVVRMRGHFPGWLGGLPADLPGGVALDWARRRAPDLWSELSGADLEASEYVPSLKSRMESLTLPLLAIRAEDDAFSTDAGAKRLLSHYSSAPSSLWCVRPADYGSSRLGHMRYLSSRLSGVWRHIDRWLADQVNANVSSGSCLESPLSG